MYKNSLFDFRLLSFLPVFTWGWITFYKVPRYFSMEYCWRCVYGIMTGLLDIIIRLNIYKCGQCRVHRVLSKHMFSISVFLPISPQRECNCNCWLIGNNLSADSHFLHHGYRTIVRYNFVFYVYSMCACATYVHVYIALHIHNIWMQNGIEIDRAATTDQTLRRYDGKF